MRIGIIGAGRVGKTLGDGWARAGHHIVYGVRDVARARGEGIGDAVPTSSLAAASVDVLVLTTPWGGAREAVAALGDVGGRPLVDVTNPVGPGFSLAIGHTTSGAEQLAAAAPTARIVKALNTTGLENMADPRYGGRPLVMPIAGEDPGALEVVAKLVTDLGFEAVSIPGLAHARELEPLALLWIRLALQLGHGRGIGFGIERRVATDAPPVVLASAPQPITIVGTGHIGGALARAWLRAGHAVTVAARDAQAPDAVELAGLGARIAPVAGASEGAAVVVLATPAGAVPEVLATIGPLAGKVVVDCTNAIARGFQLEYGHTTSSSEELAKRIPGAHVVRSFNQQGVEVLQNPVFGGVPATNFVAGDDAGARATVLALTRDAGLDAVDAGPLSAARLLEPMTLLWITMSRALGTREFGITLRRRAAP